MPPLLISRYQATSTLRSIILDVKRYPWPMKRAADGRGAGRAGRHVEHAAHGGGTGRAGRHPTDEVDDLVAAWRAERPDLDVRPMQVLSRISRLARHLDRERRSAFAAHDLESWEFDVLAALRREGAPYEL